MVIHLDKYYIILLGIEINMAQKILTILLISLLLGFLGYFVGSVISHGLMSGAWAKWQALGSPPSGAMKFAGIELGHNDHQATVYVETNTGKIYRRLTPEKADWEETDILPPSNQGYSFQFSPTCPQAQDTLNYPYYATLPGKVKVCTVINWTWEWVRNDTHYVILEDGSVWLWHFTSSLTEALCIPVGSPVIAIPLGWAIILTVKHLRHKRPQPEIITQ